MAEIFEDDGLFAEEERRRQEQERLNAEQQYQPRPEPEPDPDTAIYPVVAQTAGYVYADEWGGNDPGQAAPPPAYQDNGYEEATPTGDGWQPYEQDQQPWAHEQADEYAVDPFASYEADRAAAPYELETGSNRMYDEVLEGRFENEIDPFRNWTDQQGNQYQWDPSARRQELPDLLDFENPALAPYKDQPTWDAYWQEQRNARYTEAVQGDVDAALWQGIQGKQQASQRYNNAWGQIADQSALEDQGRYNVYEDQERVQATGRQPLSQVGYPWQAYDNTPAGAQNTGSTRYSDLVNAYRLAQRNRSGKDRTFGQDNGLSEEEFKLIVGAAGGSPDDQRAWEERWNSIHGNAPRSADPRFLGTMSGQSAPRGSEGLGAIVQSIVSSPGLAAEGVDSVINRITGQPLDQTGPLMRVLEITNVPFDRAKFVIVGSYLGAQNDPAYLRALQSDMAGLTSNETLRVVMRYLDQNQGENLALDLLVNLVPLPNAFKGAGRVADRLAGIPEIRTSGIGATQSPAVPFPHEKLSGLGVPEVRQPVAPRLESRFLPTSDYPMVDVPQQPKPPLAYEQPQGAVRPQVDIPEAPRATTGAVGAIPETRPQVAEPPSAPNKPTVARPSDPAQSKGLLPKTGYPELDADLRDILADNVRQGLAPVSNKQLARDFADFVDAVTNYDLIGMESGVAKLPENMVRDTLGLLDERGYDISDFAIHPAPDRVAAERAGYNAELVGREAKESREIGYQDKQSRERQLGGLYRREAFSPEQRAFGEAQRDMTLAGDFPEPPVVNRRKLPGEPSSVNPRFEDVGARAGSEGGRYPDANYKGTFVDPVYERPDDGLRAPSAKVAWDPGDLPYEPPVYETSSQRVQRLMGGRESFKPHEIKQVLSEAETRLRNLVADSRDVNRIKARAVQYGTWRGGSYEQGGRYIDGWLSEIDAEIAGLSGADRRLMIGMKKNIQESRKIYAAGARERLKEIGEAVRDVTALRGRAGGIVPERASGAMTPSTRKVTRLEQGKRLASGAPGIGHDAAFSPLKPSEHIPAPIGPGKHQPMLRELAVEGRAPSLKNEQEPHSFDLAHQDDLFDVPDNIDDVGIHSKDTAKSWLKQNATNFAVAPAAAVNLEQDDEDPNRGLKLMAGLVVGGGVGVAYARKGYLKKLKAMEDTLMPGKVGTAGLTPVQKRWLRLDTQRNNIAAAVGVDIRQRLVQSGLKLGTKTERTQTLNALRVYIDSGKFAGMVESVTEASILRDKQIRNVFNKIRVELKQELPKIINDSNLHGLSPQEQLDFLDRRIIAATDALMVEHVGKSIRGPVVALSEVVQRASAALVLKYNPKFAVVNTRDGLVQQAITTTLGSAGFQKQGRNIRAIERAYGEANSGVFGPAYIDQEIASQVLNTKEGIDRFNPILNITTGREVRVKTTLFQRHYDNYFTTAIAKELGLNESSWSILGNPWNNPTAKVPLNRLQGLPYKVREEIKGTKSLEEVRAIISRNNIQGKEAKDLIDIFASHQNDARAYAHAETAVQMRDYSQRSNLDTALSVVYPFHYWTTRGPEWQIHMAKRYPLAVSALAVGSLWVMHENKDVPLKDKLGIDIPVGWMLDQMPMSSAMREQVNEGLAWYMGTQNKQHDLHIGLLNWLAEPVMNTIKGSNTDNLRNLVDITDPINMALAAEKLFGYKGRSMAWNIPEAMLRGREDKLPDWLREAINSGDSMYTPKDVPKGKYYPGIAGAGGSVVRAVAESKGLGAIPQAVNQTLYGNATSPGEKKGIDYQKYANKLPDDQARKAYFGESGKKAAVALAGVQPVQYDSKDPEVNMPAAAKPGATTGQRYEDAPGSYDYDEAPNLNSPDPNDWLPQDPEDKAAYAAFVKQHGKPPADGTKESTAYWKLWGEQVAHYTPRDTTESDKKKAATAIRDRYKDGDGNIPDDAWVRIEEEQFNRGLPVDGDRNKGLLRESPEDIRDGLNQIRGVTPEHDKQAGEAWTRERVRDINSWVEKEFQRLQTAGTPKSKAEIRNQPLPWLGGNTIYEWQKKYDPNYDPNFYTPTGDELVNGGTTGAGMLTGINTANNQLMNGKDGDDKPTGSTAQYNSIWNTAFGFQDGSKAGQAKMEAYLNAPYGNTGQTRRQWADQHKPKDTPSTLTNVGAPIPSSSSSPVTSPTTSSPKVGSGATSSPSASVGAKSVSYVSTARPATTAPRAVSTPAPRTSAPASTSAPKTQTSGSPFQNWIAREKPELLQPATTGSTTNQTSGATTVSSAKQTAQAWTAWEGFYKEGKTSTAEAIPILERHVSTGGDPGPYVRRAKYQVYELIRNYQGVDRKSGDSQRGKWFAEVKALPDNVEGMKKLAAIEKLARKR